jgi:phosphoribosylaminoimidazole (AIR) synthetase
MVVCVKPADVNAALALLAEHGESAWVLGQVRDRVEQEVIFSDEK